MILFQVKALQYHSKCFLTTKSTFNISRKGKEPYMEGLDNLLETMLYYLTLISLWVATYIFPITFGASLEISDTFITKFNVFSYMVLQFRFKTVWEISKPYCMTLKTVAK